MCGPTADESGMLGSASQTAEDGESVQHSDAGFGLGTGSTLSSATHVTSRR